MPTYIPLRRTRQTGAAAVVFAVALSVGVGPTSAAGRPSAPKHVRVIARTPSSVSLGWSAAARATGYRLYRSGVVLAHTTGTSATWSGLKCGSPYRLSVQAFNDAGSSRRVDYHASTEPCSARDSAPPSRPARVVVRAATQAGVALSWAPARDNRRVVGYGVYVGGSKVGTTARLAFAVHGLGCGRRYRFSVDAYDAAGNRSARASRAASTKGCSSKSSPPAPPKPPVAPPQPPSGSALYLSPSGSDAGACTQAAPCRSFDHAYHAAKPGTFVLLSSGDYGGQSLTYNAALVNATAPVVFQPAPGATARLSGELSLRASPDRPIANVEFDSLAIDDIYVRYSNHVVFRNVDETYFFVRSSSDISFIGGSSGGDHYGNSDTIGSLGAGTPASQNILIDGVTFHDFNNDRAPEAHDECIFIQESTGVTIRNSTFTNCRDFDVYANTLFGGTITDVVLSNNHFGKTAPVGYYAFRANVGSYVFRNNTWAQGMANDPPVSVSGCGNTLVSQGLPMPSALRRPC